MSVYLTATELDEVADAVRCLNNLDEQYQTIEFVVDVYDQAEDVVGSIEKSDVGNYVFYPSENE